MKLHCPIQKNHALTLVEVLVVIVVLALLIVFMLPALSHAKAKAQLITCNGLQKEINLSFRIWEGDHTNLYPMSVSTNFGGTLEYTLPKEAFRHFQVMSNELSTPKILICPADVRRAANDFGTAFGNTNISYFINLDANEVNPQMMLSGDDNFEIGGTATESGRLEFSTKSSVTWSPVRHKFVGNIAITDGSVQQITTEGLQQVFQDAGAATNRILIP